jgi:PAS domain S-box-containing protein
MTEAFKAAVEVLRKRRLTEPFGASSADAATSRFAAARYFIAAAAVAIAGLAHWRLSVAFGPMPPFVLIYPTVLLVALFVGGGPGILAIILSALLAVYWLFPPAGSFALESTADLIALSVFMGTSVVLCVLAERMRRVKWAQIVAGRQMELLSVTMASIREGVIATDIEGRVIFLNEAAETLLGCKWPDVERHPLESVFKIANAASHEPLTQLVSQVSRAGTLLGDGCDIELLAKNGTILPIEVSGVPLRSEGGNVYGAVVTFRDCSERKRAEKELQRLFDAVHAEREWLSQVLSSINDEVYFTDTEKRYTFVNPSALREFGQSFVQGIEVGKVIANLNVFRSDGTPRPIEEAPPLRALAGEIVRDEEQIIRNPRTGELRHRQASAAPVRDAGGKIIGSVSVVRDITERKRVEEALRDADRRKNVFLATLSHELRNPLAPIRTAARLLESAVVSQADLKRCRSIISRQVAQMASLLDDLLDVSRFTRGELTLKKSYVPLQQVLDAAFEAVQPLINAKQHRLQLELLPSPPTLEVDPVRLTQVISNLLTNAAKYTDPGGEITLGCRVETDTLVIFVRDNGIGLAPEMFSRVFDMFVQVEPTKERSEGGLGIGLALVKALVELHGGTIEVHSAGPEQGTTFTVKLPRSVIVAGPAHMIASDRGTHDGPARCVLIADDNPDGAEILAMLLQTSGHTVHVANDGAAAFELAARVRPDIAVLDIGMPGLSGYEVAKRIRCEAWGARMTLIAVTGWGQEEDKREALAVGFDYHVTKPMDPAYLESIFASIA